MPIQNLPENPVEARGSTVVVKRDAYPSRWQQIAGTLLDERWLIRIALVLICGLYLRSVAFSPVYDDNIMGPWGSSLRDLPQFFAHDIFFGFDGNAHSVYYRPIAMSWGFLVSLSTGGAPGWLHLNAVLLHLAVVILAYVFGIHLFRDNRLALLTAVLFGLHPSKVESVAWVGSSMVDGLSGVFFFASMIAFLKWNESDSGRWRTASVALFACAMFTKETMVFVPILMAAYLWLTTPSAKRIQRTLRTLLPYGAVWIVYMTIRHQIIRPASPSVEYLHPTYTFSNLWIAPYSIWWYIRHLVMPWGLAVEYAAKVLERPTLLGFVLPGVGVLFLMAGALWLWRRQRSPVAGFLMFWFALTLAPPVIVAPMVSQHDRYLYIPAYAFCAFVAWAVLYLGRLPAKMRVVAALSVVALWSGLTWHEMGYWDHEETLWSRALQVSPSQSKAQLQLASIYSDAGDRVKALGVLNDGLHYRPTSQKLWLARAGVLYDNHQFDEARAGYLKVMQLTEAPAGKPVESGAAPLRAQAACQLAVLDISAKNFKEAESYARTALSLDANGVGFHSTLSQALAGEGRMDDAKAESALELHLRLAQQRENSLRPRP